MRTYLEIFAAFREGFVNNFNPFNAKNCAKDSRVMRENLSEKQLDKMLQDSFPASDPMSTY